MDEYPEVSEDWDIEEESNRFGWVKLTVKHNSGERSIVVRELPNGISLHLQKSANLPGGYKILSQRTPPTMGKARDLVERFAELYDATGSWVSSDGVVA